jgi:uncharacterized protein with FMN-binding domain
MQHLHKKGIIIHKMKKILLSLVVIIALALYGYQQRHAQGASEIAAVAAPADQSTASTTDQASQPTPTQTTGQYKDGSYTGSLADAYYGYIQVLAIVRGGQIRDVQFLRYPNQHQNSIAINQQAMPYLKDEAIHAQSADVDIVSGATDTSYAFRESLSSALAGAKI